MNFQNVSIQNISDNWLNEKNIKLSVLRLDKIDPIISGNKWFKLKYYLQEAILQNKNTIATFGGAWSNHIVATAYACKQAGLQSIGIIRGEEAPTLSDTLQNAKTWDMELKFVSRAEYRHKEKIKTAYDNNNWFWVDEGGFGQTGAKGAAEISDLVSDFTSYDYIVAAVGTGTMLAGLILAAGIEQHIIGISAMKGNFELEKDILKLTLTKEPKPRFSIVHNYHFGGYGKHPPQLIKFINEVYIKYNLPLDIVYTSKTFFAIEDLASKNYFKKGSRILMIHSGGLQGNSSLPNQVLAF